MKTLLLLVIIVSFISKSFQTCATTTAVTTCRQIHLYKTNPLVINNYKNILEIFLDEQSDTIYSNAFNPLAELKRLFLSNNKIKNLESGSFDRLSKLEELSLYNNLLTTIVSGAFRDLHNLKTLNLGANKITSIPNNAFVGLDNLEVINLSFNQLAEVPVHINTIKTLRALHLNDNKLRKLKTNSFNNLNKLEKLHLYDNSIDSLEAKSFAGLRNLKELNLKANYLKQFNTQDALADLGSLQILNLAINNFRCTDLKNIDKELQTKRITFQEGTNKQNINNYRGIKCNS